MNAPRRATITRDTRETQIRLRLDLDDGSSRSISTGVGFFDHMLEALALHGGLGLDIEARGDLHIDQHHLVEDVGIVLGTALREALGAEMRIVRFAHSYTPLDESLARAVVDISGRSHLCFEVDISRQKVGEFDTDLVEEFFRAFTANAKMTLHLDLIRGTNAHHQIEATFKACAMALREALRPLGRDDALRSTKGTIGEAQARRDESVSEESPA